MQTIFPVARETVGTRAPADHLARGLAHAEEGAGEIDLEHGVPLLERHVDQGRVLLEPGVGHQDVDRPPGGDHRPEHRLHLGLARHVGADGQGFHAPRLELPDETLGVLGADHVVDDDVRAGGGERAGDALADPGVGPGHERLLALERLVPRHVGRSSSASS